MVVVGHVDHGKSTLIGRLMADTGSLPQGKLEQVKAMCEKNARPFEYAFLLDALKDERAQGITIDTARCFFRTPSRDFVIHDAPGHVEFVKNMVTGAARAQAALLLIDAHEGVQENSRRHGYILSMLGIQQIAVVVNKMDLIGYSQERFDSLVAEYTEFLGMFNVRPLRFIPVSAREGENIATRSGRIAWYDGPTVLEQLESFHTAEKTDGATFRMPVQDVYKFTAAGDDRRIIAGTVESGTVARGDEVTFWPSGKRSRIATIEKFAADAPEHISADEATGVTLATQVYVRPGEMMCKSDEPAPQVANRIRANVLWLGHAPLIAGRPYLMKIGAAKVPAELVELRSSIDASDLVESSGAISLERHAVGECVFETARPVAFDTTDSLVPTSRFVIVDGFDIAGFGTVLEGVRTHESALTVRVRARESAWDRGDVSRSERGARNGHEGKTIVILGDAAAPSRPVARALERVLFDLGGQAYLLMLSAEFEGLDPRTGGLVEREQHLQRLGELSRVMTEAGMLFITALDGIASEDLARLRTLNAPSELLVVATSEKAARGATADIVLPEETATSTVVEAVVRALHDSGVTPEYWI